MSFSLIVGVGKNLEIGAKGDLLWHIPEDLKYYKETTMGHPILMGHRTFVSLPFYQPGRKHYIVTDKPDILEEDMARQVVKGEKPEIEVILDLDKFIQDHKDESDEIFVIGGGMIYKYMLPFCDKLYITEVDRAYPEADTFFPEFDKSLYEKEIIKKGKDNDLEYSFVVYTKK